MKESTLEEIREEYNRIKTEKETLLSYRNELKKLANDKNVKRFLELSKLVDQDYVGPSEETIIRNAYNGFPDAFGNQNRNSNYIMVFMGSYIENDSNEQKDDYVTYERDPETSYKSFIDLETEEWTNIDRDKCLEFENEHLTLYLPISEYTEKEYYHKYIELHKWFRTQLIHRSQSDVIKELQEKYEKKYKNLYPYFQKIDTIANLPIEDYIKTHPADGFIENHCLDQEELMRVKLYRKQKSGK